MKTTEELAYSALHIKSFENILFKHLSPIVGNQIGDYQYGFRKGRSTIDQIFTQRQILEKCKEHGVETHHLFIDFHAAYNSIAQLVLQGFLADLAVPKKINLLKFIFTNIFPIVGIHGELSRPFG